MSSTPNERCASHWIATPPPGAEAMVLLLSSRGALLRCFAAGSHRPTRRVLLSFRRGTVDEWLKGSKTPLGSVVIPIFSAVPIRCLMQSRAQGHDRWKGRMSLLTSVCTCAFASSLSLSISVCVFLFLPTPDPKIDIDPTKMDELQKFQKACRSGMPTLFMFCQMIKCIRKESRLAFRPSKMKCCTRSKTHHVQHVVVSPARMESDQQTIQIHPNPPGCPDPNPSPQTLPPHSGASTAPSVPPCSPPRRRQLRALGRCEDAAGGGEERQTKTLSPDTLTG